MATVPIPHSPARPPFPRLVRAALSTVQINLGYRCNQACTHCHVEAGPQRTEQMSDETLALVLDFVRARRPAVVDVTGGAPELHPRFRELVSTLTAEGMEVIDRCNLTVLEEPGQADLADFLAGQRVRIVASLPCYGPENVDRQRGLGVFAKSLRALRALNARGYAQPGSSLMLDLVYNPVGPHLPPPQAALEETYRTRLEADFGVQFSRLLTLTNMPIARFRHALEREGQLEAYLDLLVANHRETNLAQVMCRHLVSIDWQGRVHDCDFNQMLGIPLAGAAAPVMLASLMTESFEGRLVAVGEHCYGCSAGQGSSCGGALAS